MDDFDLEVEGGHERPSWMSEFIDEGSEESHNYYKARKTVCEMLRDRGYSVPKEEIQLPLQQFRDRFGDDTVNYEGLRVHAVHKDDTKNKVIVHFFGPEMIKVTQIRFLLNYRLKEETLNRLILVVDNKITSQAKQALELFPLKVEIFQRAELLVNITKHEMKPKHQLLTAEQIQRLLEKFNVKENQLPQMLETDALARYYAYEKGTVLKIIYDGEASETHETYRIIW